MPGHLLGSKQCPVTGCRKREQRGWGALMCLRAGTVGTEAGGLRLESGKDLPGAGRGRRCRGVSLWLRSRVAWVTPVAGSGPPRQSKPWGQGLRVPCIPPEQEFFQVPPLTPSCQKALAQLSAHGGERKEVFYLFFLFLREEAGEVSPFPSCDLEQVPCSELAPHK